MEDVKKGIEAYTNAAGEALLTAMTDYARARDENNGDAAHAAWGRVEELATALVDDKAIGGVVSPTTLSFETSPAPEKTLADFSTEELGAAYEARSDKPAAKEAPVAKSVDLSKVPTEALYKEYLNRPDKPAPVSAPRGADLTAQGTAAVTGGAQSGGVGPGAVAGPHGAFDSGNGPLELGPEGATS